MRNLEDCKAEVFRRSEERIKERKRKRNRALAWCIPLCLLLVAGGLYIRPLLEPMDEIGGIFTEDTAITDQLSGEQDYLLSEETTVGGLCDFLTMYFDMSPVKESVSADDVVDRVTVTGRDMTTAGQDGDTIIDGLKSKYDLEEKPADYILVFRRSTGEEFVFRLYGSYLYNEKNGCVVKLDDKQLTELKKQLEQAEGYESDK